MNLKLLNETHPLIEEAWMNGFEPVIQGKRVIVKDALPTSEEDPFEREKSRLDLEPIKISWNTEVHTSP